MSNQITGARYLAESLVGCGIDHVFFMDAILRRTLIELEELGIKRMLTHSEIAAAYMADGYARVKNGLGVCMAQSVGAANLAAGLQDAYLHRSPVLALTGRKPPTFQYRNAYQELEHAPLFQPVTKFQANVDVVEQLPQLLAQAMREATEGSPRPTHLDFAGLQAELIETALLSDPAKPPPPLARLNRHRVRASAEEISAAAKRLAAAIKPVMVVGTGAMQSGAQAAVKGLAEKLHLPIATSLGGRGIVPTTHPLHIGVVGTYSAPITNQLVHEADVIFYVGSHTGDQVTNNWTVPGADAAIIQIDSRWTRDRAQLSRMSPAFAVILELALEDSGSRDCRQAPPSLDAMGHMTRAPGSMPGGRCATALRNATDVPLHVDRLCHALSEHLPEDGILVADTGYSGIWTGTMVELRHPTQTYSACRRVAGLGVSCGHGGKVRRSGTPGDRVLR